MAAHPHFVVKVFNTELHVTCACMLHVLARYMCLHVTCACKLHVLARYMCLHVTCACKLHVLASYMCLHIDRLLNVSLKERNMQSGDAQCELAPLKSETIKQVNKKQSLESTTFEYVCEWHKRPILIRMIPEGKGKLRMIPEGKGKLRMIPEGKGKFVPHNGSAICQIPTILHQH